MVKTSWIETGGDGRPYLVRRKTKAPSTISLFPTSILPWKRYSFPFSSAFKRDHHILPVQVSGPTHLPLPLPTTSSAGSESGTSTRILHPPFPPLPSSMYNLPSQQQFRSTSQGQENRQFSSLSPMSQQYPPPPSHLYPPMSIPLPWHPPPTSNHLPYPAMHAQPLQMPGDFRSPPQLSNIHNGPPHMGLPMVTSEVRYKCRVCGRFRSPSYHHRHPLAPGQPPAETVCRRCRKKGTNSDESSSDSSLDLRLRQARSRNRQRTTSIVRYEPDRGRSFSRSSTRRRSPSRETDLYSRRYARSPPRSSSLDIGSLRISVDRGRSRRNRSPSVEIIERVRYVNEPTARRPAYIEEVVHLENGSRGSFRRLDEDDYYDDNSQYEHPR